MYYRRRRRRPVYHYGDSPTPEIPRDVINVPPDTNGVPVICSTVPNPQYPDRAAIFIRDFASMEDFIKYTSGPSEMDRSDRESLNGTFSFTQTSSFSEAVQLANVGWPDGAVKVRALAAEVGEVTGNIRRPEPVYSVAGHQFDIGRVISGDPECWIEYDRGATQASAGDHVVRIIVNASASSAVRADAIIMRGVAACVLAAALEQARIPTEILWEECCRPSNNGGDDLMVYRFPVKYASQPLDLGRMAFELAHPSCLRRLLFAANEREDANIRRRWGYRSGYGYGSPATDPLAAADPNVIYLDKLYADDPGKWTPASVIRWVKDTLTARGVQLTKAD